MMTRKRKNSVTSSSIGTPSKVTMSPPRKKMATDLEIERRKLKNVFENSERYNIWICKKPENVSNDDLNDQCPRLSSFKKKSFMLTNSKNREKEDKLIIEPQPSSESNVFSVKICCAVSSEERSTTQNTEYRSVDDAQICGLVTVCVDPRTLLIDNLSEPVVTTNNSEININSLKQRYVPIGC